MPITLSQAGHTFDVILSSKGLRVEYGGQEVFRFWPGDEYVAHLPGNPAFDETDLASLIDASGVVLEPGNYKITVEGAGATSYAYDAH